MTSSEQQQVEKSGGTGTSDTPITNHSSGYRLTAVAAVVIYPQSIISMKISRK